MSPLTLSLVSLALMLSGFVSGTVLRVRLPRHHLSEESKEAIKLGTSLIATLTALVLGLLIASAKANYDTFNNELGLLSSKVMQLDNTLADYGPETNEARNLLRSAVASVIERGWPQKTDMARIATARHPSAAIKAVRKEILRLSPREDTQRYLKRQALQVSGAIEDTRWLFVQHFGKSTLPAFAGWLINFWLTFLFFSAGLFSPHNAMVITVLAICALSAAGSVLLILELDQPYQGIMQISSEPLRHALPPLGQ